MNCKKVQEPAEKCIQCGQKFTNFWCPKCKILQLFDLETNPVFHCQIHDKCHVNMSQKLHKQCEKCGQCIAAHEKNHFCEGIQCIVCMSDILPSDDRMVLKCNPQHQMHENCWTQFLSQHTSQLLCPLCRKNIMPESANKEIMIQNAILATILNKFMFQRKIYHILTVIDLLMIQCRTCKKQMLQISGEFCYQCFSSNVEILYNKIYPIVAVQQLIFDPTLDIEDKDLMIFCEYIRKNKDHLTKNFYNSFGNKQQIIKCKQYALAGLGKIYQKYIDVNQNFNNYKQFEKILKNLQEQLEEESESQ